MKAQISIKGSKDKDDFVATAKRRVAAIIPNHGAEFSFEGDKLIVLINEKMPISQNAQIIEIANGAVMERLHPSYC